MTSNSEEDIFEENSHPANKVLQSISLLNKMHNIHHVKSTPKSPQQKCIERFVELADRLAYTHEGKISVESNGALTEVLSQLETVFRVFFVKNCTRYFRKLYTPAYQQLLNVAYKADILEAAQ